MAITGNWRAYLPQFFGLMGLLTIAYAGARHLSYWTMPLGGLIFATASVVERRALWIYAFSTSRMTTVIRQLVMTIVTQMALVAIFYLLSFGLATIVTGRADFSPFGLHEEIVLGLAAIFFGIAGMMKGRFASPAASDSTLAILDRIAELASSSIVMPAMVFGLASQIAKQKPALAVALIRQCAANHESFHVRRVAFTAVRFMNLRDNPLLDVRAFLDRGLEDEHPWVRDDAVFAADALGYDDAPLRSSLASIAEDVDLPPDDDVLASSDASLQSRVRAARLLKRLETAAAA